MRVKSTLLVVLVLLVLGVDGITQTCPPYDKDRDHIVARRGFGVDGRPIVNIYIDCQACQP